MREQLQELRTADHNPPSDPDGGSFYSSSRNTRDFNHEICAQNDTRLHLAVPVTCTALREYLPPAISHKILPQKKICIKINMLTYRAFAAGS
jgi:hypothetical protein